MPKISGSSSFRGRASLPRAARSAKSRRDVPRRCPSRMSRPAELCAYPTVVGDGAAATAISCSTGAHARYSRGGRRRAECRGDSVARGLSTRVPALPGAIDFHKAHQHNRPGFAHAGGGPLCLNLPAAASGGVPEWLKGTDCKSVGFAYVGSNPTPSTSLDCQPWLWSMTCGRQVALASCRPPSYIRLVISIDHPRLPPLLGARPLSALACAMQRSAGVAQW